MNMSNIKNTITNIAGILGAIAAVGGTTVASLMQYQIPVPPIVTIISGVCGALSVGILGYFSSKNPDGSVKTPTQIVLQNSQAAVTKDVPATQETVAKIASPAVVPISCAVLIVVRGL